MILTVKEGKNLDEVLSIICDELSTTLDQIIYKVETKKGGLFKGEVNLVKAIKISDIGEFSKEFLHNILSLMGIEVTFETKIRDNGISIKMYSDKNHILIGKNGQTLTSLQTVLRQAVLIQSEMFANIMLDVENYKDKQIMHLERLAKNVAREVALTGIEAKLDNMNSYERRIIHNTISENKKVYTESIGEEPNRYIIIKPKKD